MSTRRSKRYRDSLESLNKLDSGKRKRIDLNSALELVQKNATAKFNESVEVIVNLNLDTRHSDQVLRGIYSLPHGTGRKVTVAVIGDEVACEAAKAAGADLVGCDNIIEEIKNGVIKFDRLVATPAMMAKLGQVARILGPKGLMPNPKLGTVTTDVASAIKELKAGAVEYRAEKAGIVQAMIGKVSFSLDNLASNIKGFVSELIRNKPSGAKGVYIKSIYLSSTMGISYEINPEEFTQ